MWSLGDLLFRPFEPCNKVMDLSKKHAGASFLKVPFLPLKSANICIEAVPVVLGNLVATRLKSDIQEGQTCKQVLKNHA